MVCLLQESRVDTVMEISEREADETMRALAKIEGVFAGIPWPYVKPSIGFKSKIWVIFNIRRGVQFYTASHRRARRSDQVFFATKDLVNS